MMLRLWQRQEMENATHSEGYLRGHSVPGKEGTVLKLDFLSPTPL